MTTSWLMLLGTFSLLCVGPARGSARRDRNRFVREVLSVRQADS